jgi:hypothetical protein
VLIAEKLSRNHLTASHTEVDARKGVDAEGDALRAGPE